MMDKVDDLLLSYDNSELKGDYDCINCEFKGNKLIDRSKHLFC